MRLGVREEWHAGEERRVTLLPLEEITDGDHFASWFRRFCKRFGRTAHIGVRVTFEPSDRTSQTSWEIVDLDDEEAG